MTPQLYKQGKRKCYLCQKILDLNSDNFYRSKKSGQVGFVSECKKCRRKWNYRFRQRIIKERGFSCEKCGLKNTNYSFFDIDHIIPILRRTNKIEKVYLKKGDEDKIMVLCPNCHRLKTIADFKKINPVRTN